MAQAGDSARERCGEVIGRLRHPAPKVAELLEAAEEDLLAFYGFPAAHWPKLRLPSVKTGTGAGQRVPDAQRRPANNRI